jgi:hypothetical protein
MSSKKEKCCGDEKLCSLTCCSCGIDIKKLSALADNPKFICKKCGRTANKKENLCKPVKIK